MTTFDLEPVSVINSEYPPRMVFAGFFGGKARILMLDHPEEDIDDAIRQAAHIQKVENAKRISGRRLKRLDSEGEKV